MSDSMHDSLSQQLNRIEHKLDSLLRKVDAMSPELQNLVDQVTATAGSEASAVVAINGLAAQIAALAASGGSPAQFTDLANQLKAATDPLAAAVAANPGTPPATLKKP